MLRSVRRLLARVVVADPTLVALPAGVQSCKVYRNIMTMEEEDLVYEEYGRVLEREGQVAVLEGTSSEDRIVKHTYLEIHGHQDFMEVKSWNRKEIKHIPGLTWSPTLMRILGELGPAVVPFAPDTGRIVEHNLPGYEMHVENPTVGSSFIYVNLLCDTVLEFDDEPTQRKGQVYLPARSLACVSGEARWGFRFGERSEDTHVFRLHGGGSRRVEMDMRMSIQLWKFNANLLDSRVLQDRLEETLVRVEKKLSESQEERAQLKREKEKDEREAMEALQAPGANRFNIQQDAPKLSPSEALQALVSSGVSSGATGGIGALGGDLDEPKATSGVASSERLGKSQDEMMKSMGQDYARYKDQFTHVHSVLREIKAISDSGQPVNDMWLKKKINDNPQADPARDAADGFDSDDIEGTWDRADAKARFFKAKLKTMDYDGTAFLNPTTPDVSQDAPLDMRATIKKIAPLVKDGEKILASLPGGER